MRTDGKWLAGFYFNAALARIAAAFDRIALLAVVQAHGEKWRDESLGNRLQKLGVGTYVKPKKLGLGKWKAPTFTLNNGKTSVAYRVHNEVNSLKHDPPGLAKGRDVAMADAIAAVTEVMDLAKGHVNFSGAQSGP